MSSKRKKRGLKILAISAFPIFLIFVFSKMNSGPEVWLGSATTTEEILAKEACECMYNTAKEKGFDVDVLLGKSLEEIDLNPALGIQMKLIETMNFFRIPCFQSFYKNRQKAISENDFDKEKSKEAYKKCRLQIFR